MKETLQTLVGKDVVVDTRSPWIYIGTLAAVQADSALLKNVDVHDSGETSTPKERYVIDSRVSGIKANRSTVYVNLEYVVSVSLLADVITFQIGVKPWYIYLLRCGDGTLYTGISNDVERRLAAHRSGRGARYLRGRAPLVLARKLRVGPVGDALKVERQVKRMSPAGKEKLIAGKIRLKDLIEKDVRRQTSDVRRKTLDVSKKKKFKNKKANTI